MHDFKNVIANLSHHPGVYQMLGEKGEVLYVGKAKDLKKRIASYFSGKTKDLKTLSLIKHIKNIDITITHTENEAVLLECNLIKKHHPRYNVLLRDDKSYPYILISIEHTYPRIDIYRGPRLKHGQYFGPFPSAFAVRETINLLQKIFRIRTCRDSYFDARTRPCLLYQINRCTAPCVNWVTQNDYANQVNLAILFLQGKNNQLIEELQQKMESGAQQMNYEMAALYRDQIDRLRQIQDKQYVNIAEGNADVIGLADQSGLFCLQLLTIRAGQVLGSRSYFPDVPAYAKKEEVISAFLTQHYLYDQSHIENIPKQIVFDTMVSHHGLLEEVLSDQAKHKVELFKPSRGEKMKLLTMATQSAKQALALHLFNKASIQERLIAFQQLAGLMEMPHRIECFDISHQMGEATVASCVVFNQHGPLKNEYRRFNIKDVKKGDDVAAMSQVLERRFKRLQKENASFPEVVLIDGGSTQLAAAKRVMTELGVADVLLIGVAKGPERKPGLETLHIASRPPLQLPPDSLALHFIQHIRDEAHRFAITGHRMKRDQARRQSTLESISGIGPKRRRDLLRYFGGIQGIAHASLDELTKVPGISRPLAERIFAAIHDTTV